MTDPIQLAALLDAMQWLAFQGARGLVSLLGGDQKRVFNFDRGFTVHSTTLILDQENQLYLAMRDDPTMKWFVNLPWGKLQVFNQRKPAFVNLICKEVKFPAFSEIKFDGGTLPVFSLKIPISSNLATSLTTRQTIKLGLFSAGETDNDVILTDTPELNIPLEFCK